MGEIPLAAPAALRPRTATPGIEARDRRGRPRYHPAPPEPSAATPGYRFSPNGVPRMTFVALLFLATLPQVQPGGELVAVGH